MSVKQIKSLVQFSRGTSVVLAELTSPIPDGVVIYSIDDGIFKLGNGSLKFSELPTLFTYQEMLSAQGGISGMFEEPQIDQNGRVVVVRHDSATNDVYYGVSNVSLSSVLADISALETTNTNQTATISTLLSKALMLDASLNTANENSIVVVNSRRYSNSGMTLSGMQNQISSQVTYTPGSHLEDVIFYTNANKDFVIDKLNLDDNSSCYVDIVGFNNNVASLVYGLTAANSSVVVTNVSGSLFKVDFTNVTGGVKDNTPVVLIASIDNTLGTAKIEKAVACLIKRQKIMAGFYGGAGNDYFRKMVIDSNNNIICAGWTLSEGMGGSLYGDALVVKFDSYLNIIARKTYGGTSNEYFIDVTCDSADNIICCGYTASESGIDDALVVKFDKDLNILVRKRYSGVNNETFYGVETDSNNNIFCCGYTSSEGAGIYDTLIVKFDNNLNIIARKRYGGTGDERFTDMIIDSNNNIICVGFDSSEGTAVDALVVKFDNSLNILYSKYYGGSGDDRFYNVICDVDNNIICVGATASEGTATDAFIVKFDSSLNIIARKRYGGSGVDAFYNTVIDSDNNIICCGVTSSVGPAVNNGLIVKFNPSLNVISNKICGGHSNDTLYGATIDSNDNITICGITTSEGVGINDALIIRLSSDIPSGSFAGTIFTNFIFMDGTLTLADSTLTLANSNLTLADSTLTLSDSTLTLANSNLTFTTDIFN